MSNLFISHSSRDNETAKAFQAELEKQGHRSVFLDLDPEAGIQAGVSWERTLYTKLRACRAVIALCSDSYLESQWCFAEVALARMEGKELFVLKIDPWGEGTSMPSILTEEQFIDLRANQEEGYRRLWNGFKVKGIVPGEQREWGPDDPPYPGLRAFDETDAPIFFGRDQEVREGVELLNRVQRQGHPRMVMVLGSSGSGKSSLARAGLVPQLRRDKRWQVVGPFLPGANPARALAGALAQAFDRAGEARAWKAVLHQLVDDTGSTPPTLDASEAKAEGPTTETTTEAAESEPEGATADDARERMLEALRTLRGELTDADAEIARSVKRLEELLTAAPAGASSTAATEPGGPIVQLARELLLLRGSSAGHVLLVIDQFEELLGHESEGADHPANLFLRQLRDALDAEDSPVFVLGTMRSDYLGALQRAPTLRGLGFKSISVGPMTPEGMRQVIEEPAKLGQIELEEGLADLLLHDTGTSDALPLMAFTLRAMWDRYRDGRLLEIREYKEFGGLQGGIAQVADETLQAAVATGPESKLRDAFLSLARPADEGVGWSRQPVQWDTLDPDVQPMLQRFIDQRLLVKRADGTVEVAHEALFRSWKKLRGWLAANAEGMQLRREIQDAASKWSEAPEEEKETYQWRGGRLARALELSQAGVLPLEESDKSFIEASFLAERAQAAENERRRKRQLRVAWGIVTIVAALSLLSLYYAGVAKEKSEDAERATAEAKGERDRALKALRRSDSLRLAIMSQRFVTTDPTKALRLAEAACQQTLPEPPPVQARAELMRAFMVSAEEKLTLARASLRHPGELTNVYFSADGGSIVTQCSAGNQRSWNLQGELIGEASATEGGPNADSLTFDRQRESGILEASRLSPDGKHLVRVQMQQAAGANFSSTVTLFDDASDAQDDSSGRVLGEYSNAVNAIVFSADGVHFLVAVGNDVAIWTVVDKKPLTMLLGHTEEVRLARFSPDSKSVVTGSEEGTVRLWNVEGIFFRGRYGEPSSTHLRAFRSYAMRDPLKTVYADHVGPHTNWDMDPEGDAEGNRLAQSILGDEWDASSVSAIAVNPDQDYVLLRASGEYEPARLYSRTGVQLWAEDEGPKVPESLYVARSGEWFVVSGRVYPTPEGIRAWLQSAHIAPLSGADRESFGITTSPTKAAAQRPGRLRCDIIQDGRVLAVDGNCIRLAWKPFMIRVTISTNVEVKIAASMVPLDHPEYGSSPDVVSTELNRTGWADSDKNYAMAEGPTTNLYTGGHATWFARNDDLRGWSRAITDASGQHVFEATVKTIDDLDIAAFQRKISSRLLHVGIVADLDESTTIDEGECLAVGLVFSRN